MSAEEHPQNAPEQRQLAFYPPPGAVPWVRMPAEVKAERARLGAGSGEGMEFKAAGANSDPPTVVPEKREVTLDAALYKGIDEIGDLFAPGAFADSIAKDIPRGDVKLFLQHARPLGVIHKATESDRLRGTGRVTDVRELDTPLFQIADGTYGRASIGYQVQDVAGPKELKALQDNEHGPALKRYLKAARARELSAVLWGMHQDAHVVGVKAAADPVAADELKAALRAIVDGTALAAIEVAELREILELVAPAQKSLLAEIGRQETPALPAAVEFLAALERLGTVGAVRR
jgi:hypothetical protein